MVLKTFNLDEEVYKRFAQLCKENGISMSNQVNTFISAQIEEEPKVCEEYLKKLERIRKGNFIKVDDFKKRYLS
jgi:antitoxin component of RelBE/YafQ-DinJ toxin-antitoxin module